ncbi:toll/interleukin-1 receptor domain-containing protein [Owenweeksia hongkongensis]|uniref:toll/interleukin-1 receptor domain-containing protein n=1 Tax=Owenweeksia hongkongensis TaxID=253245 RepID=UPI003A91D2CA
MALNWLYLNESNTKSKKQLGQKCIFISHQKSDTEACREIADYLIEAGVNVYFDEYDTDLRIQREAKNPRGVTDSIRKGINLSTHMLCVISPITLTSSWVPFEVGYGFDKTKLGVLTLKGISNHNLPDYVKTAEFILRDIYDVNQLVSDVRNIKEEWLMESRAVINFSEPTHPLSNYMDSMTF